MKQIKLYGKYRYLFVLIDNEDFEEINQYKWYGINSYGKIYVVTNCYIDNKRVMIYIHRLILSLEFGNLREGDHINGNSLDNQRLNLRIVTCQQNKFNRKPRKNVSSKFKGVCWNKNAKKWQVSIRYNNKL